MIWLHASLLFIYPWTALYGNHHCYTEPKSWENSSSSSGTPDGIETSPRFHGIKRLRGDFAGAIQRMIENDYYRCGSVLVVIWWWMKVRGREEDWASNLLHEPFSNIVSSLDSSPHSPITRFVEQHNRESDWLLWSCCRADINVWFYRMKLLFFDDDLVVATEIAINPNCANCSEGFSLGLIIDLKFYVFEV